MLKKLTIILTGVVGVSSKTMLAEDVPIFTELHSMLSNTANEMDTRIQNMMFIEEDLGNGIQKLQWLAENNVVGNDDQGLHVAEEALDKVAGAITYVNQATDEAADVKRIEEVLGFIREKKVILKRYTGDMLT